MQADDRFGARRRRCDLVDVERRGVGGQNAVGPDGCVERGKDLLLQRQVFEDRLDHEIGGQAVETDLRLDQADALLHRFRR